MPDGRPYPNDSGWELPWLDFPVGRAEWEKRQRADTELEALL